MLEEEDDVLGIMLKGWVTLFRLSKSRPASDSVESVSLWTEEVEKCYCWSVRLWYGRWTIIVVVAVLVGVVDKVGIAGRSGILVVEVDIDPVGASAYAWTA